ncbi:MAG: IS200/IS605 family transposase [Lachnospiraceae bacterium]|nr:IS200/IS605 family transposase [Lachnospiraceae bacterium]MCH4032321.1 IS200/IS605 family transposase [Lachnospiraceae bacterium]MCH4108801.1 IS200/IS605 family transposase [Lachnospiraceae bacterium]MCI1302332.1 IS200/IS605 family transposase [Lachnospiraceae bacterium]MCI1360839.1 IS200/IS605 family transposase [Lachnospiraceae bacterium]
MLKYKHRRHNKNLLMVHIIFVCKYRRKLLTGSFDEDLKQYLYDACVRYHWYIKRMQSEKDHIHILLQYNPTDSITKIVSVLKQYSTYHAWRDHGAMLRHFYWKENTLWSDGYFAASVGQVSQQTIERYIEQQG